MTQPTVWPAVQVREAGDEAKGSEIGPGPTRISVVADLPLGDARRTPPQCIRQLISFLSEAPGPESDDISALAVGEVSNAANRDRTVAFSKGCSRTCTRIFVP